MTCSPSATAAEPAWPALGAELRGYVARRVRPDDVDDVVQDALLRIHRGLGALHDAERLGPWVGQVARSAVIDHLRARGRRGRLDGDVNQLDEVAEVPVEPDTNEAEAILTGVMAHFVAALPSPYREALTLTELQGVTQRDAAAALGVSVSGMKSRVQRGRARLRAMIEACCTVQTDARGRVIVCAPRPDGVVPDACGCVGEG